MIGNIVAGLQDPGFAAVGDFDSIATVTVASGGASSIDFTSLPTTYQHLQIRALIKVSTGDLIRLRLNSDANTNYARHRIRGSGTAAIATAGTSLNSMQINSADGFSDFGALVLDILDYRNTNKNTTARWLVGIDTNGGGGISFESGLWLNTNAVTDISLSPGSGTISQYSHFALYGIKG